MSMIEEEDRKLFCGGLPQDITQDELKEYFGKYGELERVQLKMDPNTGRSRGFAFILYRELDGLEAAAAEEHNIRGKKLTAKKADVKPGKIYLGKLPADGLSEDDIRTYFSEFGTVTEFVRPIDKMKNNEPKNFCFVTFEKDRVAKKMVQQGQCNINGHRLMIKQVTPNPRDPSMGGRGGMMGGRGGARGGAAGGYGGGWGADASGYGAGGGYGGAYGGYGADASGGYGDASGYGAAGYGAAAGGYGAAAGGYGGYGADAGGYGAGGYGAGYGGAPAPGKMRGGGGGRGAPRGRGRGRPY